MKKYFFDKNSAGTTNFELIEIAEKNNIDVKIEDVMMMDMLKDIKLKSRHNLIVNLQDSGEGGSHWEAVVIRGKKCLVVDSFGCSPHRDIIRFCMKNKLKLAYTKYICQELKSVRCGIYSLQAIRYLQNSTAKTLYDDANNYVNEYGPLTLKENENIVMGGLTI